MERLKPNIKDREGSPSKDVPRDEIFDVLSNKRRQCVLHYLKRNEGRRVELRELVDYVAAWENDTTLEDLQTGQRKRVYTALRQSHLPKLDDAGIVDYAHLRGEVELTDNARETQMYLEYVPNYDIPWSKYYLGLSVVAIALVVVTWIEVFPFAELSGLVLSSILVSVFAVSAVVHTYHSAKNRIGSEKFDLGER